MGIIKTMIMKVVQKCMQWCRKWPYIAMLMLVGVVYLTGSGNWEVLAVPFQKETETAIEKDTENRIEEEEQETENFRPEADMEGMEATEGDDSLTQTGDDMSSETNATSEDPAAAGETGEAPVTLEGENGETTESVPVEEIPTWRDPSEIVYTRVEDSYFSDAVFLGDSRTVGMYEYGGLGEIATFYASTGLNIYKMMSSPIVEVPETGEKISVEEALQQREFAKIYMMIGINEMGTGTVESFMEEYRKTVERLRELQPDAIIYLQGIMKVTTERSQKGDYIHNEGIEERNAEIAKLADNIHIYYLDVNSVLCDETGGMEASYTFDGVHLKAQYIEIWKDYLKSHAVYNFLLD